MKFLITGAEGMLGRWVAKLASKFGKVYAYGHDKLNILDRFTLLGVIKELKPNVLINCAGIVKGRKLPEDIYYKVNGHAPKMMAQTCREYGVFMTQISTDCVFKGDKPHTEIDPPNAPDVYGHTKAMGEHGDLIIRSSFLGIGHRGLIDWMMGQKGDVSGYKNVLWNGISVFNAAYAIIKLTLNQDKGIYHVYGPDTTKYDVLCAINKGFKLGLKIHSVDEPNLDMRLRHEKNFLRSTEPIGEQLEQLGKAFLEHFSGDSYRPK